MSTDPAALDLDAIRARADAATEGPWRAVDLRHQRGGQIRIAPDRGVFLANVIAGRANAEADAEFIAAAREDVSALLAEVERLTEHSTWLNTIGWKVAKALDDVPSGAEQIEGQPVEQVERLIAEVQRLRRRDQIHRHVNGELATELNALRPAPAPPGTPGEAPAAPDPTPDPTVGQLSDAIEARLTAGWHQDQCGCVGWPRECASLLTVGYAPGCWSTMTVLGATVELGYVLLTRAEYSEHHFDRATAEQRGRAAGLLHAAAECHRKKWGYDDHDPAEHRPTPTFDALHALGCQLKAELDAIWRDLGGRPSQAKERDTNG